MKRLISMLALMLILVVFALLTRAPAALADTSTATLTPVGSSGYTGGAVLTTTLSGNTKVTEIAISNLTDSIGTRITGSRVTNIYHGTCAARGPFYQSLSNSYNNGTADTQTGKYYFTLPPPPPYESPHYDAYTITITGADGNVAACLDVGMPSVNEPPTLVLPFRIVQSPVRKGTLTQVVLAAPVRLSVQINLVGNLANTRLPAFVRPGTCYAIDTTSPPRNILTEVVNGRSSTILTDTDFLPPGYVVDVEQPGAAPGDFVACAETGVGMPTTGNADPIYALLPLVLGALALVMLVLGLILTRRASRRYTTNRVCKE